MTTQSQEKKYYTPSIEEFHVGFEYEVLMGENTWNEFKCKTALPPDWYVGLLEQNRLRVKYLDEEDILAEGWQGGRGTFSLGKYWLGIDDEQFVEITNENLYVEWNNGASQELPLFQGTIRNRSELRQIMRMTGIAT